MPQLPATAQSAGWWSNQRLILTVPRGVPVCSNTICWMSTCISGQHHRLTYGTVRALSMKACVSALLSHLWSTSLLNYAGSDPPLAPMTIYNHMFAQHVSCNRHSAVAVPESVMRTQHHQATVRKFASYDHFERPNCHKMDAWRCISSATETGSTRAPYNVSRSDCPPDWRQRRGIGDNSSASESSVKPFELFYVILEARSAALQLVVRK